MIVRPGIVCPSSSLATRPNDDCEVGILLTRESWGQLKSDVSKALSPFITKKGELFFKKPFTNAKKRVIITI